MGVDKVGSSQDKHKDANDFVLKEVQNSSCDQIETGQDQTTSCPDAEYTECQDDDETPIRSCCQKFIKMLKMISAVSTITCDVIIFACSIGILVLGCLMQDALKNYRQKGHMELVRILVSFSYQGTLLAVAQVCIATGVLYIILVPLSIVGVVRRKRKLLKFHNMMLLINLFLQAMLFYFIIFRHVQEKDLVQAQIKFHGEVKKIMKDCSVNKAKCCCWPKLQNVARACWQYETAAKKPTDDSNDDDSIEITDSIDDAYIYSTDCRENKDLFKRVHALRSQAYTLVPIFLIIQAIALVFAWLEIKNIPEYGPDDFVEPVVQVKIAKNKKKKNMFLQVLFFFAVKKGFFLLLILIVLPALYKSFQMWARNKTLTALCFGLIQKRVIQASQPLSEHKKRRKYRAPPKNKFEMVWRKSTEMCFRRLLVCLFAIMFLFGILIIRLYNTNFSVPVGDMSVPILDFLSALWENAENNIAL